TGQQVGLFSGPAYTLYKAITAARLARDLTNQGVAAVPIFWLATEDHDFAEVNHAWMFDASYKPVQFHVDSNGDSARQRPVGGIALAHPPVDQIASLLEGFEHGSDVAAAVRDAYRPGFTMGEGFRALLKKLLGSLDLLFLDPLDPAVRAIAAPIVSDA